MSDRLYTWFVVPTGAFRDIKPHLVESDVRGMDLESVPLNQVFLDEGLISYNSLNQDDFDVAHSAIIYYLFQEKTDELYKAQLHLEKVESEYKALLEEKTKLEGVVNG